MTTYKVHFKLIRILGLGFAIYDPRINGFCITIDILCFELQLWNRGNKWIGFSNYWSRQ